MIQFEVPCRAVPYARPGTKGTRRYTPKRQAEFRKTVKTHARAAMGSKQPMTGAVQLCIIAEYAASKSGWKKTRADIDNVVKEIADSINKIVFIDDAQIASLYANKIFGSKDRVIVSVLELEL